MLWFPLPRGTRQHIQEMVGCWSLAEILLPTISRHLPQLRGVAAGDDKTWFPGTLAIKNLRHCYVIVVLVKWVLVRWNLGYLNAPA